MPERKIIAEELSKLLSVLSHPHRIRIIEELAQGPSDVATLCEVLEVAQPTVSQHLAVLRNSNILSTTRCGRKIEYNLEHLWLADWLLDGLKILDNRRSNSNELIKAAKKAQKLWNHSNDQY